MHVVVGGASGFLGSALVTRLAADGHTVTRLVRGEADPARGESLWDPRGGDLDQAVIVSADAVINLSGSPISQWPRTPGRRREILDSRLGATRTLASAIARTETPPVFLSGSGMSWYGVDRGETVLSESESPGTGFLADVAQQWEDAAQPAVEAGARTCFLRTSLVLDRAGGVLRLMLPAWKLGGGATLGSGHQRMSLISRSDWVGAVVHLLTADVAGPVNLAFPDPPTNAEFTAALGRAVHRPTLLRVPGVAVRAALGGLADDLLGSLRLRPDALTGSGYAFTAPDLPSALADALA